MAKHLDEQVAAFRNRPLDAGPYAFVWVDALTQKVREGGRIINVHALVAVGVNADGHREILGLDVATAEDGAGWLAFLRSLTARGLGGVQLVVSDAHTGLVNAIGAVLPGASWQRCRTHYARNLLSQVPKSAQPWVATLLRTVFEQPDTDAVHAQMRHVLDALEAKFPKAADHLDAAQARSAGVHRVPPRDLAADLVEQPAGAAEQGDPPPHRRRRDLPRPHRRHPPGRRRPGRAERRMDRSPPLHEPRTPHQNPNPPERVRKRRDHPAHRTHRIASEQDHRVAVDTPLQRT